MITRPLLRALRNDLPMAEALRRLGPRGPYAKSHDGRLRFVCPHCGELHAVVNPRNNLAHCFHCAKNTNNIDLLMAVGYDFLEAVELLEHWLRTYTQEQTTRVRALADAATPPGPAGPSTPNAAHVGAILRQEFGKQAPASGA
jgi:hypothetical protein